MQQAVCFITGKQLPLSQLHKGDSVRENVKALILEEYPAFSDKDYISTEALAKYRQKYLEIMLKAEIGELSVLEKEVVNAIASEQLMAANVEVDMEEKITLGEKISDKIALFGGSWTFIITFFIFIVIWMTLNVWWLANKAFDPYPFILLNLILSCIAAIQAPIIMMSQNRQEQKDRQRSEHDYKINLKAELEIRMLHEKIDHLIIHQNQKLMEIQQVQVDFLEDILRKVEEKG